MNLYQLTERSQRLLDLVTSSDGELNETLVYELNAIQESLPDAVTDAVALLKSIKAAAAAYSAEKAHFAKRQAAAEWAAEKVEDGIKKFLVLSNTDKVRTKFGTVCLRRNPKGSVTVAKDMVDKLPEHFQRIKVEPRLDLLWDEYRTKGIVPEGVTVMFNYQLRIG